MTRNSQNRKNVHKPIQRDKVAEIMRQIATSDSNTSIQTIAGQCHVKKDVIYAMVDLLTPFGVLFEELGSIKTTSEHARDFLLSFSRLVLNQTILIEDWRRCNAECQEPADILNRGVCFLKVLEERRIATHDADPIRTLDVSKAIIKARENTGRPDATNDVYLMHLHNNNLQFVGGLVRDGETREKALNNAIRQEIPSGCLRGNAVSGIERMMADPLIEVFVSPTSGVYTKYMVQYYFVHLRHKIPRRGELRWVTMKELEKGEASDGTHTIPPPDQIQALKRHLTEAGYSFSDSISLKECGSSSKSADSLSSSNPAPNSLAKSTLCLLTILVVINGSLSITAHFVPKDFRFLTLIEVPLLLVTLAFIAAASGIITGPDMVSIWHRFCTAVIGWLSRKRERNDLRGD